MARVLIVDDEQHMRQILATLLGAAEHQVSQAASVAEARTQLGAAAFDVVLTDYKLPDGDGLAVLDASREVDEALPVVLLTAFATIDLAVESMRRGAFDFITKPFQPGVVRAVIARATERASLVRENERLRLDARRFGCCSEIVGQSAAIEAVRAQVGRVASSHATVLITGETGTGKELVARALHDGSPRRTQPFVALNCAAVPEGLLESELFGHERGAFTGADRSRPGLFEAAHRGTLFLDEVGEMPLALQAKLLRVLADGHVLRIGARAPIRVDVRILAATHADLAARVGDGSFRQDLYYRLAVIPLHVPALRERMEDLPLLVEHFVRQIAVDTGRSRSRFTAEALEELASYSFPGNVRELRNIVERSLILAVGDEIRPEDVGIVSIGPPVARAASSAPEPVDWSRELPSPLDLRATLESIERALVCRALQEAKGVQAEAARRLALTRSDIAYKIKRLGIEL